ncbi:hypothetical protein BN175_1220018 [Clostridioides difficile T23]|uniref:Uncharacterized protein n=1 Tax=Clostridioides difficile TaxID=1496 RepID=A0A069AVB1_CLODI|nr:hypothetical protein BN170_1350016 [Clostridioides difficile T22]CCL17625.1 hypothetical protein BN171_1640015 [Clostridioides difficile E25]CCL21554.1 hypothetical protein BN172_2070002 [Clostridioides difficile T15]CCL25628.1 hypothetical protein BN173_1450008 [Clostridioides difficile T11]CCL29519.1 hypothetical protein BN174_1390008 [Clostridioides difficile E15]CCL33613.1 hypothetical protein BN175_1220018 [Clostridioides difficile T23]CCL37389.1 hypothetical protein BN176_1360018 [Cl
MFKYTNSNVYYWNYCGENDKKEGRRTKKCIMYYRHQYLV